MEARNSTVPLARGRSDVSPQDPTPALFVIEGRGIAYGSWGAPDNVCNWAQGHEYQRAENMRSALRTARHIKAGTDLLGPRDLTEADFRNYHPYQQRVAQERPSGRCAAYDRRNCRCELAAYGDDKYCESPHCCASPMDDHIVRLGRNAFHRLYGRRRHTCETLDFRRHQAEKARSDFPEAAPVARSNKRRFCVEGGELEYSSSPSQSEPYSSSELVDSDPGAGSSDSE